MKMFTATVLIAFAALAAPAAVGQSQSIPVQVAVANPDLVQAVAKPTTGSSRIVDFERTSRDSGTRSSLAGAAPSPAVSWLMALAFLGIVAMRRTRSFF